MNDVAEQSIAAARAVEGGAPLRAAAASAPLIAPESSDSVTREAARQQAAEEIKEALRDRADQQRIAGQSNLSGQAVLDADVARGAMERAGFSCVDDFAVYLTSHSRRQEIIDRFLDRVRPLIEEPQALELDIISHSWGTVVAYEGLRQLEAEDSNRLRVRNFFTVGSALSIGPVKLRLREENKDGKRPASVRRWINIDAQGDLVGGPLKGRPFEVDIDLVNLEPVGCDSLFGFISPQCAHRSYFQRDNLLVNKHVFARFLREG